MSFLDSRPALEVRGLEFSYRFGPSQHQILRHLDFTVNAGDFVAIQGPSGSGKSTLFHIIGCLLHPTRGSVFIDGEEISSLSNEQAALVRSRKIGFVFQQFHLLPRATVLDNILLGATYPVEMPSRRRDLQNKALELLERLGLKDHAAHMPNQLSGGQQQRVALARALLNDANLILADEPTGNLDSRTAQDIMRLFSELSAQGKTIVIITHDPEVARRCARVFQMRDGQLVDPELKKALDPPTNGVPSKIPDKPTPHPTLPVNGPSKGAVTSSFGYLLPDPRWRGSWWRTALMTSPLALANLARNRAKSALTMLGIVIGIAAVLAMITLGQFTKSRIMEGFEALGVNKLVVRGYPNWDRQATDASAVTFTAFDWQHDLAPLRRIFPEIALLSPVQANWQNTITAGGRSLSEGVRLRGVNEQYLTISNAHLIAGRAFSPFNIADRASVCLLGYQIATQLFGGQGAGSQPDAFAHAAIGQLVTVAMEEQRSFPCQVIGVLGSQKSNQEWFQPDLQILTPYTTFTGVAGWWSAQLHEFAVQVRSQSDVEVAAKKIKAFFNRRYGKGGRFIVDAEGTLVAQTKRFLGIFAFLLASIAFLALLVGGIGIHNMMLVSVTERIKEIGLRKALGATNRSLKIQVLTEAMILCAFAGAIGISVGIGATEALIWAATKLVPKLKFEWVLDPWGVAISVGSVVAVGLLSGLVPARRAERLQVIEALRAE